MPADQTTAYAEAVAAGEIVAGPYVRAACARHLRDLVDGGARGLTWDVDGAQRAINFCRDVLTVTVEEQDELGDVSSRAVPFVLAPWQAFIVGSLFGWRNAAGFRRFRRAYVEIGKGNGKALALDTPVPTPTGWSTMGSLRPGNTVFDEYGHPCRVTAVSGILYDRPCYRLRFSDGCEIVADADHLWRTAALRSGGKRGPKPKDAPRKGGYAIRTTEEIARTLALPVSLSPHPQAKWNHRVDVAGPLALPEADLPIPPYTLGVWLGDGDSDSARITVARSDWEIVEAIEAEGVRTRQKTPHTSTIARVVLGDGDRRQASRNISVQARLRALALLGDKHIPVQYLRASRSQRAAVLQGLMDADGYAALGGQLELTLTNARLAGDAMELIRSLGMKPTVSSSDAVLNGRVVGIRHRIQFWPTGDMPVFQLRRKQARIKPAPLTRAVSRGRMIVGCDPVPSVPVQCISVDSPSRMFLAGTHFVPTHNSPLAAAIGHYMLTGFRKLEAEVYSAATDLDQATILFRDACAMYERSRALRARLTARGENPIYQLDYKATRSFFKPISAEKRGKSGIRPHCALIDEVHEHRDNSVIEMLRAGTKGNQEALIFEITNSGFDRKSVCWFEHEVTAKIATGEIENDAWFGFIASLDEDDDPFEDESCWIKANPNLGVSIHLPFVREQVAEAKGMPSKEGLVRRLHFCQWTDSETSAIPRALWIKCVKAFDPEELTARGIPCFGGLDLSRANDLTAFTLSWLLDASPDKWQFASKTWFWTPKDTLAERSKRDRAPYEIWAKNGLMEAVPGKRISYSWVATALGDLCQTYSPAQIGCDAYGLENLAEHLTLQNLELPCVVHPQGFNRRIVDEDQARPDGAEQISLWMPDSINKLEAALLEERITVFPNEVMNMCSRAVVYEQNRTGHRMFNKEKASGRIDGMVSLAMSIGVATVARAATSKSFWETA